MPGPKNGERPYLATPKPGFWDPIFGHISTKFPDIRIQTHHRSKLFFFLFSDNYHPTNYLFYLPNVFQE